MRIAFRCSLTVAALALILTSAAWADVPTNMNVQGRLADSTGAPAPVAAYQFTFRLFDADVGGTQIWPGNGANGEQQIIVLGNNGLWSAAIGTDSTLTESVFLDTTRWLEVTVSNFIDPAETLPRVKLNTNAYSYRSGSSQQADDADLLDGLNSTAFAASAHNHDPDYVDVTGDIMTGDLDFDFSGLRLRMDVSASEFQTYRTSGVLNARLGGFGASSLLSLFGSDIQRFELLAGSNWGQQRIFDTDGSETIDLRANQNLGGEIELNQEDGSPGMELLGGSTTDGSRVLMYNAAGALAIALDADVTGTGAVSFPAGAIGDIEILDEPGISQGRATSSVNITNTAAMQDIAVTTIAIPTSGYIVVEASASIIISGVSSSNFAWLQIDETAGGPNLSGHTQVCGGDNWPSTSARYFGVAPRRTYFKSAGTYTFRFEGRASSFGGSRRADNATITATFFPTGYGTVSTVAQMGSEDEFESATLVPVVTGAGEADRQAENSAPAYEVDLRELEVRAARAEAAAEKAARELREARSLAAEQRQIPAKGNDLQGEE